MDRFFSGATLTPLFGKTVHKHHSGTSQLLPPKSSASLGKGYPYATKDGCVWAENYPPLEPLHSVRVASAVSWTVPSRLKFIKKLGSGAYGCVASFEDKTSRQKVAVKKIGDVFKDLIDAKRILRELKLLGQLRHEHLISILDIFYPESPDFDNVYLVSELMDTDLHKVIHSDQELTEEHLKFFLHQLLRGVAYLHSGNILHRDLKPSNILVDLNCDLKICDFGLARSLVDAYALPRAPPNRAALLRPAEAPETFWKNRYRFPTESKPSKLTEYVVTRWYRPPEVILTPHAYAKPIDVWSVGCIFAELLGRRALFQGQDQYDQLSKIVKVLGTPPAGDLTRMVQQGNPESMGLRYFSALRQMPVSISENKCVQGIDFAVLFPDAPRDALDLLSGLLQFNPADRLTVREALQHPYLSDLWMKKDGALSSYNVDWTFDCVALKREQIQASIYEEIAMRYHPSIAIRDRKQLYQRGIRSEDLLAKHRWLEWGQGIRTSPH